MAFSVDVKWCGKLAKVQLTELNNQGKPKDGRCWYTNINIDGIDLEGESVELPAGLIEENNLLGRRTNGRDSLRSVSREIRVRCDYWG